MFDALAARAVGAEINGTLLHGRVQGVLIVDPLSIGLEVYAYQSRRYILITADPDRPRLHLVTEKLRAAPVTLTPFMLLLKKYVNGSFLNRVEVVPRERILHFEFDHAEHGTCTLVVEIIGRRANMILLDPGGTILDAVKRIPSQASRTRVIEPRVQYKPPPPQAKADPLELSAAQLGDLLARAEGETLAERLVQTTSGTSPLFARELAFRVAGDERAIYSPAQVAALHAELWRVWRDPADPTVANEDGIPVAVAAYELRHLPRTESLPSMSAALEKFFGAAESYAAAKAPLRRELLAAREKLARASASLRHELVPEEEQERLRQSGDLILAHLQDIAPGQRKLRAEMFEGAPIDILLNPQLTPVENAQRYFAEYKRARDAGVRVPERLEQVEGDLAYVDQIINDLDSAESRSEIDEVIGEAREADLLRERAPRTNSEAHSEPRVFYSPDGFQVLVGRNARQNDEVTFERARPDDLWLHARGVPGAHVVILTNGLDAPASTVEFGAALAAFYSGARAQGQADVSFTARKNVRRVSGRTARPGLVTLRDERVLRVKPDSPN